MKRNAKMTRDLITTVIATTPIQHVSRKSLADAIRKAHNHDISTEAVGWHLKTMRIHLATLDRLAKEERVREMMEASKGHISSKEVQATLTQEGFKCGISTACKIVRQVRDEMEMQSGRIYVDWERAKVKKQVIEAIDYVLSKPGNKLTNPKIAHRIMQQHGVMVSNHIVGRIRDELNKGEKSNG